MEETRESKSKGVPSNPVRLNCWTLLWKLVSLVMLSGSWVLLDRKDDLLVHMKKSYNLEEWTDFVWGFFVYLFSAWQFEGYWLEHALNQFLKDKLNKNENQVIYFILLRVLLLSRSFRNPSTGQH